MDIATTTTARDEEHLNMHPETTDEPLGQSPLIYEHSSEQDLCDNCRTRPWAALKGKEYSLEAFMKKKDLKPSECRICRLLKRTLSMEGRSEEVSFRTRWGSVPITSKHSAGPMKAIYIFDPISRDEFWGGYFANPYIMVSASSVKHKQIMTDLERLYSPRVDLEMVKRRIADCDSKHQEPCVLKHRPKLQNLRVIDCREKRVVNWTGEDHFVALSYVWGDLSSPTASFYDSLVPWQLLPKTIQQSMQVTLELGYRFLWIDRYCTRQTDLEDTKNQIAQMANIYLTADLTIIAAAGEDPSYGLPGVYPTFRPPVSYETVGPAYLYALPSVLGTSGVLKFKWASRGWTYQEGSFARRRLIFTDHQAIFLCNTSTSYEATPVVDMERASVKDFKENDYRISAITAQWKDLGNRETDSWRPLWRSSAATKVSLYSQRSLKYDADALSAISGALNTLVSEQIYHIWGLLFRFDPNDTRDPRNHEKDFEGEILLAWDIDGFRRRRKCLPSWSPLGWEGRCYFWDPSVDVRCVSVETLHGRKSLSAILPQSGIISMDFSQELYVDVETAEFTILSHHSYNDADMESGITLAIRYTDEIYVVLCNNGLSVKIEDVQDFKCSRLPSAEKSTRWENFLLLQNHGKHYEPIGMAYLRVTDDPYSFIDANKVSKYPDDPERWKCTSPPGKWTDHPWQKYLKSETIVIG